MIIGQRLADVIDDALVMPMMFKLFVCLLNWKFREMGVRRAAQSVQGQTGRRMHSPKGQAPVPLLVVAH